MSGKSEYDRSMDPVGGGAWTPVIVLDQILVAIAFMTRFPVPYRAVPLASAVWAFPIAGALVGCVSGAVLSGAVWVGLPAFAAAILYLAVSAAITGALHEDGLADCADGFWGGTTPERRIEIMRDSRSGAYGVLALILASGFKAACLASIAAAVDGWYLVMLVIAVHAVARAGLPAAMAMLAPAARSGLAAMAGRPTARSAAVAAMLGIAAVLGSVAVPALPPMIGLALLVGVVCACVGVGLLARVKLGGLTGDVLGAMEQIAEIVCLGALAVLLTG